MPTLKANFNNNIGKFDSRHCCALVLALVFIVLLPGCAFTRTATGKFNHMPYRMNRKETNPEKVFASTVVPLPEENKNSRVTLGYVEFDDQGELWRAETNDAGKTQLTYVLADMEKKLQKGPLKTVVFIHGWRNDASPSNEKSGNLADFKKTLLELGKTCGTPVYGVYIAWRGGSLRSPDYALWDVWDRDAAAKRVGGPTMLTALRSISAMAHRNPDSRVLMIGHSFGGKILTQVASQHLASEIGQAVGSGQKTITPLADTVVVLNSATNGPEMRQVRLLMRDYGITYRRNGLDVPLFVTISSESDTLVRYGLPVYLRLNRDFLAFPDRSGHVANSDENYNLYSAMGFNSSMIEYKLTGEKLDYPAIQWKENEPAEQCIKRNLANGSKADQTGLVVTLQTDPSRGMESDFKIVRTNPAPDSYRSPYWGFTVPDFVVHSHSGLWQPNLLGLISAFEGMSRPPANLKSGAPPQKPTLKIHKTL